MFGHKRAVIKPWNLLPLLCALLVPLSLWLIWSEGQDREPYADHGIRTDATVLVKSYELYGTYQFTLLYLDQSGRSRNTTVWSRYPNDWDRHGRAIPIIYDSRNPESVMLGPDFDNKWWWLRCHGGSLLSLSSVILIIWGVGRKIALMTQDGESPSSEVEPPVKRNVESDEVNERLFMAVKNNDLEDAAASLKRGASANYSRREGESDECGSSTPVLYAACVNKNEEMVELLLAHGADPHAEGGWFYQWGLGPDLMERTPCLVAAMPSVKIVGMLLEKGANVYAEVVRRGEETSDRKSAMAVAASYGDDALMELLKRYRSNPRPRGAA